MVGGFRGEAENRAICNAAVAAEGVSYGKQTRVGAVCIRAILATEFTMAQQYLSQVPRTQLRQEQRLTAQIIQAMDILQLNGMALEARVSQEIDSNPALEYAPEEDYRPDSLGASEAAAEQAPATEVDREFDRLDRLVTEYDYLDDDAEFRGRVSRDRVAEEGDAKLEMMANATAHPLGLQEHLLNQWHLAEIDEETRTLGEILIGYVDDTGRLAAPLEQILADIEPQPPMQTLEFALAHVQGLEPAGVAARDLRETLMLQLAAMPGDNWIEEEIVDQHLTDVEQNRLPQIARKLNITIEDVKAALEVIGSLSMHPGLEISGRSVPTITPDIIVEYDSDLDRYHTRLTRPNTRELRISPEFRELLQRARHDKSARDFARQKVDAANTIIDAIKFRRERLLEVAKAVVEAQRDFLDHGEQHLKVLLMSELAQRFNCDPSTISRTVDEKYIQTPRGTYPLRRFFTGGAETADGQQIGWDSIKAKVQEIVDQEDKSKPLSDDAIMKALQKSGIEIKRRTVAKYRSQLSIPTARQRRVY